MRVAERTVWTPRKSQIRSFRLLQTAATLDLALPTNRRNEQRPSWSVGESWLCPGQFWDLGLPLPWKPAKTTPIVIVLKGEGAKAATQVNMLCLTANDKEEGGNVEVGGLITLGGLLGGEWWHRGGSAPVPRALNPFLPLAGRRAAACLAGAASTIMRHQASTSSLITIAIAPHDHSMQKPETSLNIFSNLGLGPL